jgi:hypothetical protein
MGATPLVLLENDAAVETVQRSVSAGLPGEFRGWPVRFGWDDVEVTEHVTVTTVERWLVEHLGVDATAGMSTLDWLLTPQQRLLGVVAGAVHADETGSAVTAARLVRDCMRLALLIDRRYAPYQKWLGTAFARGRHDDDLPRQLAAVVAARDSAPPSYLVGLPRRRRRARAVGGLARRRRSSDR